MSDVFEAEVIKAVRCEINLGEAILEAYMLPSGEKRLGIGGTGVSFGYAKNWLGRLQKEGGKRLESLRDIGYTGYETSVRVIETKGERIRGSSLAKTISVRDFTKLATYEAVVNRNLKAIILLAAFAETGLERILEDAFAGRSIEFFLEKIVHFSQWTYEELEEVLQYNREELQALYTARQG